MKKDLTTRAGRILVATDDATTLDSITRLLEQEGHEVRDATTWDEVLERSDRFGPDLVLLEFGLTGLSGPEILARIRADALLSNVAVVMLGPENSAASSQAAGLIAGADGWITRPVGDEELLARVRLHLRQNELAGQLRDCESRLRTEQQAAKDSMLALEQRYQKVVEHIPDMVFINREDRIVFINPAGVKLLRADSEAQILGHSPYELFHPDAHDVIRKRIAELRKRPMVAPLIEHRLVALDGKELDIEVIATSFQSGQHMDIQVIGRDISARKRLEAEREALLAREQAARREANEASHYYRSLFESAPGCYLVLTPGSFEIVGVSEAYLRATRTSREDLAGRRLFDIFPDAPTEPVGDWARSLRASLEEVKQTRRAHVMTVQCFPIRRPEAQGGDLEDRYWSPLNVPVLGPGGELAYIIHRVEDVTEYLAYRSEVGGEDEAHRLLHSRAEQMEADIILRSREIAEANRKLQESQAMLDMASRISHLGAWAVDLAGQRLSWSDEVHEIHDVPIGQTPTVDKAILFYVEEDRDAIRAAFTACAQDGVPYDLELKIITAKGKQVWVRTMGEAVRDESGRIVRVQGALQDISERKRAQAREKDLRSQLTAMIESMGEGFIALDRGWRITYINQETERILRIGRREVIGRSLWDIFPDAVGSRFDHEYRRALRENVPVALVEYFPPLELWAEVRAHPSEDGLAIYFRDVTRERVLEERIQQSQRLESVGQLTGGVAHDFNNLLTVILGNAELLHEELLAEPRLKPLAEMISSAARRGADLTQSLLAFARRQALEPSAVDVNQLVAGMHGLLQRTLGESIEIRFQPAVGLEPTLVDPAQLESALLNLCLNARDAMPEGGHLTIETGMRELDSSYTDTGFDLVPGEFIMIAVSDTGCGILPNHKSRIFEPFFTTKEKGKGTGLGLSMVYGFIKQSGGQLDVYSEPGEGTTLRMYLPRAGNTAVSLPAAAASDAMTGGNETILLVEDDDLVRRYAHDQLIGLGYVVIDAANGPEALEIVRQRDEIDLLFTDIVMPGGMNGRQLAEAACQLHPGLKVLYTSGYTENAIVHHGRLDPGTQLLSKPYRRGELAARVRSVLDQA
jgi:PAS domain S-box-containing protein